MRLVLHRRVRSDVDEIMYYYERAEQPELAQDFYRELRNSMLDAAHRPDRHHIFKADLRRANRNRFPYHFLYRVAGDCVRVLVVRHHRRHPEYGLERERSGLDLVAHAKTRHRRGGCVLPAGFGRARLCLSPREIVKSDLNRAEEPPE
ncbi:MAG: type II toxin-antitoxin system RelE/ParE family toxin [Verrucomicrobiota bacterium]